LLRALGAHALGQVAKHSVGRAVLVRIATGATDVLYAPSGRTAVGVRAALDAPAGRVAYLALAAAGRAPVARTLAGGRAGAAVGKAALSGRTVGGMHTLHAQAAVGIANQIRRGTVQAVTAALRVDTGAALASAARGTFSVYSTGQLRHGGGNSSARASDT